MRFTTIVIVALGCASAARAQDTLPRGIGAYQLGARVYVPQTYHYDENGDYVTHGSRFAGDFTGKRMLAGKTGASLYDLASELRKFAGQNPSDLSIVEDLRLGSLKADVNANIMATVAGLAFGWSDDLTVYAGVPFVSASVRTDLEFSGPNNALEIRDRLGSLAFEELAAGLEEASRLNTDRIVSSITDAGYESLDYWEHRGIGDVNAGLEWAGVRRRLGGLGYKIRGKATLEIPTGYRERQDVLTDISFGKGAWTPGVEVENRLIFPSLGGARGPYLAGILGIARGLPTTEEKRVPEADESIVKADRLTNVSRSPGTDMQAMVAGGASWGPSRGGSTQYGVGWARHLRDTYTGDLKGDYDSLAEKTDELEVYHELKTSFSTAGMYRRGKFPVPFVASLTGRVPIRAINRPDDRWVFVTLTSFFSTPMSASNERARRAAGSRVKSGTRD